MPEDKPAEAPKPKRPRKSVASAPLTSSAASVEAQARGAALLREAAEAPLNITESASDAANIMSSTDRLKDMLEAANRTRTYLEGAARGIDLPNISNAAREQLERAVSDTNTRYRAIIEQAGSSASRSYQRAMAPPSIIPPERRLPSAEVAELEELRAEVSRVSETVGDMAAAIVPMAAVARDAQEALLRLEQVAGATLDESARLRGTFEKGQVTADRAARALIGATVALVILTAVLIYLTWILVQGHGA